MKIAYSSAHCTQALVNLALTKTASCRGGREFPPLVPGPDVWCKMLQRPSISPS